MMVSNAAVGESAGGAEVIAYANLAELAYPPNFAATIMRRWQQSQPEMPFTVQHLDDALLYQGGVLAGGEIFDHGHVVSERIVEALRLRNERGGEALARFRNNSSRKEPRTYCSKPGSSSNYGHFIVDCAPVLRHLHQTLPSAALILDKPVPKLERIYDEVFSLIGVDRSRLAFLPEGVPTRVRSVGIPTGASVHPQYKNSKILGDFVDSVIQAADELHAEKSAVLWVARGDRSISIGRSLENEEELQRTVARTGRAVQVFEPWKHSFLEQVRAFRNARIVIGVMGAAMTTALFCHPGTPVVHLTPAAMPGLFYFDIARMRALRYIEVRPRHWAPDMNEAFSIATADFAAALAAAESD